MRAKLSKNSKFGVDILKKGSLGVNYSGKWGHWVWTVVKTGSMGVRFVKKGGHNTGRWYRLIYGSAPGLSTYLQSGDNYASGLKGSATYRWSTNQNVMTLGLIEFNNADVSESLKMQHFWKKQNKTKQKINKTLDECIKVRQDLLKKHFPVGSPPESHLGSASRSLSDPRNPCRMGGRISWIRQWCALKFMHVYH